MSVAPPEFSPSDRHLLLDVARESVAHGLAHGEPLLPHMDRLSPLLRTTRATFVTLKIADRLRGCIGTLQAVRPLVLDVSHNAYAAAFRDPRFPSLGVAELVFLQYHISVLSPAQPMSFESEEDLLSQLRPGIDGLILTEGSRRGTFLPAVWEQLPDSRTFFAHLKLKAGLPADYWSPEVRVSRYTTESFC